MDWVGGFIVLTCAIAFGLVIGEIVRGLVRLIGWAWGLRCLGRAALPLPPLNHRACAVEMMSLLESFTWMTHTDRKAAINLAPLVWSWASRQVVRRAAQFDNPEDVMSAALALALKCNELVTQPRRQDLAKARQTTGPAGPQ